MNSNMNSNKNTNYELEAFEQPTKVAAKQTDLLSVKILPTIEPPTEPRDAYKLVYIVLLIHGIGNLLPWNMFINAEDYFRSYKLNSTLASPEVDSAKLDQLRAQFLSYLSIASMLPNTIFTGLNLVVDVSSENLKFRINMALVFNILIFGITLLLAFINSSSWPIAFFYITLLSVCILQMFSGIFGNSLFGVSAHLPQSYVNAILMGNNTSGVFTSIINILCIAVSPGPKIAAIYYFSTALLVLLTCLVTFNLLPYLTFFRHHHKRESIQTSQVQITNSESITDQDLTKRELISEKSNDIPETVKETLEAMMYCHQPEPPTLGQQLRIRWEVLKECWLQCLNLFLIFAITLALFPSVLANIKSTSELINEKYYAPITVFLVFNSFALLGNVASSFTTWPGKDRLWIPIILRLIFVPFFLYCNFKPSNHRSWPILIESDWVFVIGNMLFASSSGYFSSLGMMFVSSGLQGERASIASMWGSFFLTVGLLVGANSSFLMTLFVS